MEGQMTKQEFSQEVLKAHIAMLRAIGGSAISQEFKDLLLTQADYLQGQVIE